MIMAFMGNDGSGKTTIAKELVKIFRDLGFEVVYKHEYQYTILRLFFKIIGMEKIESERKEMIVEKRKSWKYYLWPYLVWFDICFSYVYFKLFRRREIVILDRYLHDHYMSFKYLGHSTKLSEWLYMHSPKPDVCIVLWVKPKIAYLRKKSTHTYSISFYVEQTKSYLKLAKNLGIKAINTNKSVGESINEILKAIPESKLNVVLKRGIQNKVLFSVMENYGITSCYPLLLDALQERKKKLKKTLSFIKEFFQKNGVSRYSIVKTLYSDKWIGNDVDILVSSEEFNKIVNKLKESVPTYVNLNQKFLEKGKVDIKLSLGLPIDLHSFIGWRNVAFISSDDILKENYLVKREDGLFFVNERINSIILTLTHVFEKGFITMDEYNFLKKHFNQEFLQTNFPYVCLLLRDYIPWFKKTSKEKRRYSYPLFIPIGIIIKSHLRLLLYSKNKNNNVLWKSIAFIRDIPYGIFWRIRYIIKNKLPYEVNMNAI